MRAEVLLASLLLVACVSKNPPVETRHFHPRVPDAMGAPAGSPAAEPVRLVQVVAAPYLGDRIVWRFAENEIGFDELNRWAASPTTIVEDALKRHLSPQNGFLLSESATARTLSVYVAAFEVDRPSTRFVVQIQATLRDPSGALQSAAFEGEHPATIDDPRSVAEAAGEALATALRGLGEWLRQALGDR
jgi:uncharacterized lipoprotein YmbA